MESPALLGLEVASLFQLIDSIEKPTANTGDNESGEWPKSRFMAESDRFQLWAVNLGLFVPGHGSLDYRVREAGGLKDTVCRFLKSLITALQQGNHFP